MNFTNYLKEKFKNNGMPKISNKQAVQLIEIISVEGLLVGLLNNNNVEKGYDVEIYKARKRLKDLTKSRTPEQFYRELTNN